MPKIKDLGIKVIPETIQPPEVGGGGCGAVTCGISPAAARACFPTNAGCTDCTVQNFSICGTTPCGFFTCGVSPIAAAQACLPTVGCTDCTVQQFSICGTTPGGCLQTFQACRPTFCACTVLGTIGCTAPVSLCGPISPRCGISIDPTIVQQLGEVTLEQIAKIKEGLRQQIAALEEHEKTLGPKTAEEIDAREKQLNDELAQLKARRKDLK